MPVQKTVNPAMTRGAAGTHVTAWSAENAPVQTRALEGNPAAPFGLAAIRGTVPGSTVRVPSATFDASNFEGVIMNNALAEVDMTDGDSSYTLTDNAVGVSRFVDAWVKVDPAATTPPVYGTPVQVVAATGLFTTSGGVAIPNAMFTGAPTPEGIAPAEFRRG